MIATKVALLNPQVNEIADLFGGMLQIPVGKIQKVCQRRIEAAIVRVNFSRKHIRRSNRKKLVVNDLSKRTA